MNEESEVDDANIIWIGGPAAAGKTTVSRLFAQKYGFIYYSVDAKAFAHEKRAAAAGIHVLGTGPGNFDRRPMIIDDVRALATETMVVVEGAFVTPAMAGVGENAVWQSGRSSRNSARYWHAVEWRNDAGAYWAGCAWGCWVFDDGAGSGG
ncbi:hypothetical protein [Kribbella pratensis]|uniref:hypothetical protein n=1 Tax=Kribbella pratensis TaxID=2512112 RepID=UPI0014170E0C|nr:hypothetical protein [Kribbella pratensis]